MKRLPIFLGFIAILFSLSFNSAYAQETSALTGTTSLTTPTASSSKTIPIRIADTPAPIDVGAGPTTGTECQVGGWCPDANVTFVGKTASRSGDFLDWTLRNYDWACVTRTGENVCSNANNPLIPFWALIRNIVYGLLIIVVLIAAFVMIITRGRSLTITRFIPRFIFIIVLVTLSYALIQFIYQVIDIIQGFFLRADTKLISTRDLIFIGFDYKNFMGLKRFGQEYDESAFITLLLVRLTAITYYVMTGVLIIRKIILWFFIIL